MGDEQNDGQLDKTVSKVPANRQAPSGITQAFPSLWGQ